MVSSALASTLRLPTMTNSVRQAVDGMEPTLSEEYIQECFHSYLKSSLTHAKVEGLLDEETLSSAEADLMITGAFVLLCALPSAQVAV